MAMKYKCGSAGEKLDQMYTLHNAILHRFAFDHSHLLWAEGLEAMIDDKDVFGMTQPPSPPAKRPWEDSQCSSGRVAKEKCFCSNVDLFFMAEMGHRGTNIAGNSWEEYVEECVHMDYEQFEKLTVIADGLTEAISSRHLSSNVHIDGISISTPSMHGGLADLL
ncbi:hypothetical protein WOLCODRAFT_20747 [Wolfiporia cocos MD-104 SS10]|uniref:Uncharacterized protein n=1 Tax=Wolfiporia cocos (strain MD-104) TaxID=742152 RepID=A0A2H3J554_WOLCO|nr:hypothetical protein WOLCODRAFT_20747 [Wolfiporia cocos MD-104 SS10]